MRLVLAILLLFCGSLSALAGDDMHIVGAWIVMNTEDRLGEGGSFIAATREKSGLDFAVRCLEKELSIALLMTGADPKPLTPGQIFLLKLRVDKGPIENLIGKAISERLIQIETTSDLVKE